MVRAKQKQQEVSVSATLLKQFTQFFESRGEVVQGHLELALRRHLADPPRPKRLPLNTEYMAERLQDKWLLSKSVSVGEFDSLAVPAGGKRRGGFCQVAGAADAKQVIPLLALLPGFENLRFVRYSRSKYDGSVWWGDPEPELPESLQEEEEVALARHDVERGRYFGYTEEAIREFAVRVWSEEVAEVALAEPAVSSN